MRSAGLMETTHAGSATKTQRNVPHHRRPPQGSAARWRAGPALPASPLPRPAGMRLRTGVSPSKRETQTHQIQEPIMAELRSVDPRILQPNPDNPRRTPVSPAIDEQMLAAI